MAAPEKSDPLGDLPMMPLSNRTVMISEPHPYSSFGKYGGHQYAKVFARHGWKVVLLSASFNWWRLHMVRPGIAERNIELWRTGGKMVAPNILNVSLAHPLPACIRLAWPLRWLSPWLYIPSAATLLRKVGSKHADLLWLNGNNDWLYRQVIPHTKMVLRIIDNYAGYETGSKNIHPLMHKTMAAANGVFACSHYVRDLYCGLREDIKVIPNGVDWDHFSKPVLEELEILRAIPHPRAVYMGAIAAWFDWELLCSLAIRMPQVKFVIVGEWLRKQPAPGAYPANLYVLGPIAYDVVPKVLAHCDVGIVPFKISDLVQGVSPIKVYEYMAAGLPVVATRWRELAIENLPITLAESEAEFEAGLEKALHTTESEKAELRRYAQNCTWEQRLRKLLEMVGVSLDAG